MFGALKAMAYLGAAAAILGVLALSGGQPYAVYYPLLLLGTISTVLGLWLPRSMNKRYEAWELRRMQALDACQEHRRRTNPGPGPAHEVIIKTIRTQKKADLSSEVGP